MCIVEESGVKKILIVPTTFFEVVGKNVVAKDALDLVHEDAFSKDGWNATHEDADAPENRWVVRAVDVRRKVWKAQTGKNISQVLDRSYGCSGGPGSVSTHAIKTIKLFYCNDSLTSCGTSATESIMMLGKTTLSLRDSRVELPVRTRTLTYPDSSASLISVYSVSPTNMIW